MSAGDAVHWSTLQLVSFLEELSPEEGREEDLCTPETTLRRAVLRICQIVDAEIVAVVREDEVLVAAGFGRDEPPVQALVAAAQGASEIQLGPLGQVHVTAARLRDRSGTTLVAGQTEQAFTAEARTLIVGLARTLGLVLQSVRLVGVERQLRRRSDRQALEAFIDPLTRLANRRALTSYLDSCFAPSVRAEPVAVLYLDLDGFKAVNDTLGHPAGDELLVVVADRLRVASREGDFVARIGGDEFAIVVRHAAADEPLLDALSRRITDAVTSPVTIHGNEVEIGVSIGVARRKGSEDPTELLRHADVAMYRSKAGRRGAVVSCQPAMSEEPVRRMPF
jgi:diguanylate cyclase (GGDEF)-like protein